MKAIATLRSTSKWLAGISLAAILAWSSPAPVSAQAPDLDDVFETLEIADPIGPLDYLTHTWLFSITDPPLAPFPVDPPDPGDLSTAPVLNSGVPGFPDESWYFWQGAFSRGIRFRSFEVVEGVGGPDFDEADSKDDANAVIKDAYITVQVWLPGPAARLWDGDSDEDVSVEAQMTGTSTIPPSQTDFAPLMVVASGQFEDMIVSCTCDWEIGPDDREAIQMGRYLASRGVVCVRWIQGDHHGGATAATDEGLDHILSPLWEQFGFSNESSFDLQTREWMMSFGDNLTGKSGDNSLSLSDLRLEYRFALAQGALVTGTFVKEMVKYYWEAFGDASEEEVEDWTERVMHFYSGGSKDGTASKTVGAFDRDRTVGIRVGGAQFWSLGDSDIVDEDEGLGEEWDDEFLELSAINRYETDWLEDTEPAGGRIARSERIVGKWIYDSKHRASLGIDPPYYSDVYVPSETMDRFLPSEPNPRFLIIDDVGTHDGLWPLGSSEEWRRKHDGLEEDAEWTLADPAEDRLDVRLVRNINKDHGRAYFLDTIEVTALAVHDTELYAAGIFGLNGSPPEHRVAKLDGDDWVPVGSSFDGPVYALAVIESDPDVLYAGGGFKSTEEGSTDCFYLAKLDAGDWVPVTSEAHFNGAVRTLLAKDDALYVGGEFTQLGNNVNFAYIAVFESDTWDALEEGLSGPVYAMASGSGDNVYVGGSFETENSGPTTLNGIARWTGTAWAAYTAVGGIGVAGGPVRAIAYHSGETTVYIGGEFTSVVGMPALSVARRTDTEWEPLSEGVAGPVHALYFDPTNSDEKLYVGGEFNAALAMNIADDVVAVEKTPRIARWDVTTGDWEDVGEGLNDVVLAIIDEGTPEEIVVGGRFQRAGTPTEPDPSTVSTARLVAHFDGDDQWSHLDGVDGRIDEPLTADDLQMRNAVVHLLKHLHDHETFLPRVDRAAFDASDETGPYVFTLQVHTSNLPNDSELSFRVHLIFGDDRDFRRFDGPSTSPGLANRFPADLGFGFPSADGRYYNPNEATVALGRNTIDEAPIDFERASVYFDTKPWEDRFFTVIPTSVVEDENGFYTLTFSPPEEYPFGVNLAEDPLLIGCIAEMRVGRPDDGEWDDVAMTEVAFANDDLYDHYDAESLPDVCNCAASMEQVWPSRARADDFVYIVGDSFFILHDGNPSSIQWIRFYKDGTNDYTQVVPTTESDNPIEFIGSRVVRCEVPELDPDTMYGVAMKFVGGNCGGPDGCAFAEQMLWIEDLP